MGFTCEKCGWWADINGVCVCGYSGRPITRHDSCAAWKTSIVTNADRIRAMTDEELAELFRSRVCIYDIGGETNGQCLNPYTCKKCWLDWLREVEK